MKIKFIYIMVVCALILCGITNAMDKKLELTDGQEGSSSSGSLTLYQGSGPIESSALSSASQNFTVTQRNFQVTELMNGSQLRLMLECQGDAATIDRVKSNILFLLSNPDITLSAQKAVQILQEDTININLFNKLTMNFLVRNDQFIDRLYGEIKVSDKFKSFQNQYENPFGHYPYKNNCFMFSLMFFFDKNPSETVEFTPNSGYNSSTFKISKWSENNNDKKMDFPLKKEELRSGMTLNDALDTISMCMGLSGSYDGNTTAFYKFDVSKRDESLYSVNVLLSTKMLYKKLPEDQKLTKFLVQITPK